MSTSGPDGPGTLRPTRPAALVVWALGGLAIGWLVRPLSERVGTTAPVVSWAQPLGLLLVAAILAGAAWSTWRTVHVRHDRLETHRAINRLVLAGAGAIAGALVGGGYLGYAASWVGDSSPLADQRVIRAGVAAVAGLLTVAASLLLERACRIRSTDLDN